MSAILPSSFARETPLNTSAQRERPSDLVRLQRPKKVPRDVGLVERRSLGAELVHVVLAEVAQSKRVGSAHRRRRQRFS